MRKIGFLFLILFVVLQACQKAKVDPVSGTQVTVWNEAKHNAFTDLIKYNDNYFCVFREATSHDSYNGKLRIIQSSDGKIWNAFALLTIANMDLRDPHFFIDGNSVLSVSSNSRNTRNIHTNLIFKLINDEFVQVNTDNIDNDYWLWGFTKSNNNIYTIGYNLKQTCFNDLGSSKPKIRLFTNTDSDCKSFKSISSSGWINSSFKCPCESSITFINDTTIVAIVRDEHTPGFSHIGKSLKPYISWQWQTFPYFVRGPKLALLPDGRIFLAAGSIANYEKTCFVILNPDNFSVDKINVFPSGGDTGYPGVVIEGNTALVSYYSSHEGNARVYIERITY